MARSKDAKSTSVAATHRACFLPLDRKSRVRGSALRRRYASLRVSTPSRYPVSPLPRCCSPRKALRRSSLLAPSFKVILSGPTFPPFSSSSFLSYPYLPIDLQNKRIDRIRHATAFADRLDQSNYVRFSRHLLLIMANFFLSIFSGSILTT